MTFGQKRAPVDGWTSVIFGTDRITVAHVVRRADAKPQVRSCESFAREGSDLDALKRLKKIKQLLGERCTTLLWHGQYQLLLTDAPDNADAIPSEELRETTRWRIKEMIDFPVETAGIDVIVLPRVGSQRAQMWAAVGSREALQSRVHLFQDAKITLEAIDLPDLAQRNLGALFEEPNKGLALVAFDSKGGRLTVNFQGELFAMRHIDVSGPALGSAQGEGLFERVLLDIQRTLDNFDRNYSTIPLSRLLVGPLPGGKGFPDYLARNLSLPVKSADLSEVLDIADAPDLADVATQYSSWRALGAALRE